jgi:hypothetical protein
MRNVFLKLRNLANILNAGSQQPCRHLDPMALFGYAFRRFLANQREEF